MPQGIPTGHSCSKRIYAFAVLAGACIGKRHVPRRRRKALLRVPVGGNAARHSHRTLMLQADLRIRRACRSVHRKKTRTAPQAQGAFASARRGAMPQGIPTGHSCFCTSRFRITTARGDAGQKGERFLLPLRSEHRRVVRQDGGREEETPRLFQGKESMVKAVTGKGSGRLPLSFRRK